MLDWSGGHRLVSDRCRCGRLPVRCPRPRCRGTPWPGAATRQQRRGGRPGARPGHGAGASVSLGMVSVISKYNIVASGPEDAQPMLRPPTASAATRTCGASWPPRSPTSTASSSSTTSARAAPTPRRTTSALRLAAGVRRRRRGDRPRAGPARRRVRGPLGLVDDRRDGPGRGARALREPGDGRPSPRYIDDGAYRGGFAEADIVEMLGSLESNYLGWSAAMAPAIMNNPDRRSWARS